MANANYSVQIINASKELSAKERVQLKDTTDCVKLDVATKEAPLIIHPAFYAELAVHNDRSEDKDYGTYIVVDEDGTRYATGSQSFWSTFLNIMAEMEGESEPWAIKVYRMASKNRQGKDFITCSLI